MKKIITIKPGGVVQLIHDDRLAGLYRHGETCIRRASQVNPGDPAKGQNPLLWYADLALSRGPVLGGFKTRQEAMQAVKRGFMGVAKVDRRFENPQVTVISPEVALLASEGTVSATLTDGRNMDARFGVPEELGVIDRGNVAQRDERP